MGKRKTLVSAAVYHDFEAEMIFTGRYLGECTNDEGKVIGFIFVNDDGEEEIITNAYSIEKALNMENEHGQLIKDSNVLLEICFLGKTIMKKTGKPFNRFQITALE
jgi:hypothetical protein